MISWQHPPSGWIAVNTDGSVIPALGIATAGGVIRNNEGRFLQAFSVNLGGGSIMHAELAGIAQGLRSAWESGARKVKLQTDSAAAISLLQSDQVNHPHYTMTAAIRNLLARDWEVSIDHVFREGNYAADYMASVSHDLPVGIHLFDVPDPRLSYWLMYDLVGVQMPRSINI
ncbi:unnamed protein product [Linum tenue]|uniref:RNase H type-1 domain-containing protein n=1 Tax=Linum tenue TaxID=586396 RepID=A0AAV0MRD4_9ROSI|nr:unnamed protein product [Linum tenue]CAI0448608.1 unnamed protein product [Linum tenue]